MFYQENKLASVFFNFRNENRLEEGEFTELQMKKNMNI